MLFSGPPMLGLLQGEQGLPEVFRARDGGEH